MRVRQPLQAVAVAASLLLLAAPDAGPAPPQDDVLTSSPALTTRGAQQADAAEGDAWTSAVEPRTFEFPRDHAAHEDYKIEWWYYTGNVDTPQGRRFGYQLTFFRTGVTRRPENPSRWTIRDLYLAHFAVSDIGGRRFHFFDRTNRGGIGWAGAETGRYRVWNGDWEARLEGDAHLLTARADGCAIDLRLVPQKPPVLHGQDGLSRKGPSEGNASHYYSFTRLETSGTLTVDGNSHDVSGLSWMDHEFSTSFLEKGQQGWDWLSIQLDDGRELMIYQIRRSDGTIDPYSSGTLIAADGSATAIRRSQFELTPGRQWRSPATGAEYPTHWRVLLPELDMQLQAKAAMPDQELNTSSSTGIVYWEGSIDVQGTASGRDVSGRGYLEMTGYAGRILPSE